MVEKWLLYIWLVPKHGLTFVEIGQIVRLFWRTSNEQQYRWQNLKCLDINSCNHRYKFYSFKNPFSPSHKKGASNLLGTQFSFYLQNEKGKFSFQTFSFFLYFSLILCVHGMKSFVENHFSFLLGVSPFFIVVWKKLGKKMSWSFFHRFLYAVVELERWTWRDSCNERLGTRKFLSKLPFSPSWEFHWWMCRNHFSLHIPRWLHEMGQIGF